MTVVKQLSQSDIPQIIKLSKKIFNLKPERDSAYHNPAIWQDHLISDGIIYGAFIKDELIGYIFSYAKYPGKKIQHIWMTGVLTEFQHQGVFKQLLNNLIDKLKKQDIKYLTLNTYQQDFPIMYLYMNTHHKFKLIQKEEKIWDGEKRIKSYFKMKF